MDTSMFDQTATGNDSALRLIRLKEVMALSGLSRAGIYRHIQDGTFPTPVKIGGRASAWVSDEVQQWIAQRIADREQRRRQHRR